jgi:hypothetical protein
MDAVPNRDSGASANERPVGYMVVNYLPGFDRYIAMKEPDLKITNGHLIRLAGLSALITGPCYVLVGIFYPANVHSSVTTTRWEIVHVLVCAMSFFGVLGLTGLYARQARLAWACRLHPAQFLDGADYGLQLR